MKVYLPNSAHIQNINSFFNKVEEVDEANLLLEFHPKWVSVHPAVLSFIAACGLERQRCGDRISIAGDIHQYQHRSLNYLKRMNLFDILGLEVDLPIIEHESAGRFIPVTQVKSTQNLSGFINETIPLLHATPEEAEPIKYVLSELIRNVFEHANSKIGAIVSAQYYKNSKKLAIGIADAGVGIQSSISRHHGPLSDLGAMQHAMKPGISGTTNRLGGTDYNAGAGLFFTKSIAAASRNFFFIRSGNALFKLLRQMQEGPIMLYPDPSLDKASRYENLPDFSGTVVGIDISVESGQLFSELMKIIYQSYNLDIKKGKKAQYKKPRFS